MSTIHDSQDLIDRIIIGAIVKKPENDQLLKETLDMMSERLDYYYQNASDEEQGETLSYSLDIKYFSEALLKSERNEDMSLDLFGTYITLSSYIRMRTLHQKLTEATK